MKIFSLFKFPILLLIISEFVNPIPSYAGTTRISGPPCSPNEPGRGGIVDEKGPPGSQFDLFLTDWQGNRLNPQPPGFPKRLIGDANGEASFKVPTGIPGVCDAENDTILPPIAGGGAGGGARAVLKIESIFFDEDTGKYILFNIFDTIDFFLGENVLFNIPDLYADTNDDGELGVGDVLYSLVDLNGYLEGSIPNFSLGDTFTIVNGEVPELPFMFFSTSEFIFNEDTGFTGTPYSGEAIAATQHSLGAEPIPEPTSTLGILALGTLGAGSIFLRKKKRHKVASKITSDTE